MGTVIKDTEKNKTHKNLPMEFIYCAIWNFLKFKSIWGPQYPIELLGHENPVSGLHMWPQQRALVTLFVVALSQSTFPGWKNYDSDPG